MSCSSASSLASWAVKDVLPVSLGPKIATFVLPLPASRCTKARIIDVRADRIREALNDDLIVLVAGFQGVSTSPDVTTLGRGGSDTTAVALAAAIGAEVCEIYTDVAGVFTADPRVVPGARKLAQVSFEEMLEMAASGAKVLQPRVPHDERALGLRTEIHAAQIAGRCGGLR